MSNPIVVELVRGPAVESVHAGAIAVSDAAGKLVLAIGDVGRAIYPRSAVKLLQALPLVECGAADDYGFGARELALACSSHNGEAAHVDTARGMLARAGRDGNALECGPQPPERDADRASLHRANLLPSSLHNNCSGKHAGFVCLACHEGEDPTGYVAPDHFVQAAVRRTMAEVVGVSLDADICGIDGCSIPTYAVPLDRLARGFARIAGGEGLTADRASAGKRLMAACMAEPFMVGGTGRFCTRLMEALPGRVFAKIGAEGVYCAALPELGLGIALKADDGASRAAEVMVAATIARLLPMSEAEAARLAPLMQPRLVNWMKRDVGFLRPAGPLAAGLAA